MKILLIDNKTKDCYFYIASTMELYFVDGQTYTQFLSQSRSAEYKMIAIGMLVLPLMKIVNLPNDPLFSILLLLFSLGIGFFVGHQVSKSLETKATLVEKELIDGKLSTSFYPSKFAGDIQKIINQNLLWHRILNMAFVFIGTVAVYFIFVSPSMLASYFLIFIGSIGLYIKIFYAYPPSKIKLLKSMKDNINTRNEEKNNE